MPVSMRHQILNPENLLKIGADGSEPGSTSLASADSPATRSTFEASVSVNVSGPGADQAAALAADAGGILSFGNSIGFAESGPLALALRGTSPVQNRNSQPSAFSEQPVLGVGPGASILRAHSAVESTARGFPRVRIVEIPSEITDKN